MPSRTSEGLPAAKPSDATENERISVDTFSDPHLDPVDFLNGTLSRLSLSKTAPTGGASSLSEVSSSTQTLLSQLSAQSSQLSAQLTQLTDEILRSGSRLAYEVEILRGDTIGLHDAVTDTLQDEVKLFGGLPISPAPKKESEKEEKKVEGDSDGQHEGYQAAVKLKEPEFIQKLRMLNDVKLRLEDVIAAFGEAMEWPLAPSELSAAPSFISVSTPEATAETESQEEKGRDVASKLRAEVQNLLSAPNKDTASVLAAARRVEHLRNLSQVWKGTMEEKARTKFVEGLAKLVDERKRALGIADSARTSVERSKSLERSDISRSGTPGNSGSRGGLFRNLQRLRDEIYLE